MTTEQYFKKIKTPIVGSNTSTLEVYHLYVGIQPDNKYFVGNFLDGTDNFFYKKNFKSKTLNGLMIKIYNYRRGKT